jgi:hypothetical protein
MLTLEVGGTATHLVVFPGAHLLVLPRRVGEMPELVWRGELINVASAAGACLRGGFQ